MLGLLTLKNDDLKFHKMYAYEFVLCISNKETHGLRDEKRT